MENKQLKKASKADFEKRTELKEMVNNDKILNEEYIEFLNKFDWSPERFEENGKVGLKTSYGKILVPAIVDDLDVFSGWGDEVPAVVAYLNGKAGVIKGDGTGEWIIKSSYDEIGFPNSITFVGNGNKYGIINIYTEEIIVPIECDIIYNSQGIIFDSGYSVFKKGEKYGILSEDGILTETIFDEVEGGGIGDIVKVRLGNEWGYIDEKGKFTLDEDDAYFFYDDGI